jgi:hypothetical protein
MTMNREHGIGWSQQKGRACSGAAPGLLTVFAIGLHLCAAGSLAQGAEAARPRVVEAIPAAGAKEVDPQLMELRVVFDQPMSPRGWSVVGGGPAFPKLVGKARWENEKTFAWSWRLEPEHDYWLSINNPSFTNFRGTNGQPALPYPISFRTAKGKENGPGAASGPEAVAAANRDALAHLRRAVDEDYSYRDLRKVNWEHRFLDFSPKLEAARTPREFARLAAELLAPAEDIHLWLEAKDETVPTWQRRAPWNIATTSLPKRIPQWRPRGAVVCSGLFDDGIRYLFIKSWPANALAELEPAFEIMADAAEAGQPLIIDVRANGGGSETAARQFAGCFVERPVVYARDMIRRNGKFSAPFERTLSPNRARPRFRGRVAVLMGQGTVSSCESFVMMMKQAPGCTLLGDRTAGCSGNPQSVDLGNGVVAFVPSWKDLRLDGTCLEGEGFAPDVPVRAAPADFQNGDPVLEAALRLLRARAGG